MLKTISRRFAVLCCASIIGFGLAAREAVADCYPAQDPDATCWLGLNTTEFCAWCIDSYGFHSGCYSDPGDQGVVSTYDGYVCD